MSRNATSRSLFLAGALLVSALAAGCGPRRLGLKGNVLEPPLPAPDFVLSNLDGDLIRVSDHTGQVVVLFFGYTHCPDVCPTTPGIWSRVIYELGDDARRVLFAFITVDPERDSPNQLRDHLSILGEDIIGLTGSEEELGAAHAAYRVYRERVEQWDSALGYAVAHTSSAFVIDRQGMWRLRHLFGMPVEDVVHDLRQLLRQEHTANGQDQRNPQNHDGARQRSTLSLYDHCLPIREGGFIIHGSERCVVSPCISNRVHII